MEKVTIITVVHDAYRFTDLCTRAVHKRTPEDHEHIIIDNGSDPTCLAMLDDRASKGWITLHKRKQYKNSGGHAQSLEWFLYEKREASPLICLLDSDAYPVKEGWLTELYTRMKNENADAVGCVHFRNDKLLHPSCMLFHREHLFIAGRPTFRIKKAKKKFYDTAMIACEALINKGFKLLPISREEMEDIVRHRWCGTRVENAKGQFLDDQSLEDYNRETALWFEHPSTEV